MTRPADLPVPDGSDLRHALGVAEGVQRSIEHADRKIAALAALHGGVLTLVVEVAPRSMDPAHLGVCRLTVGYGALAVLVAAMAVSGWHLAAGFRPRLGDPHARSRFAFPVLARQGRIPPVAAGAQLRDEAWGLAVTLALIAERKHGRIASALRWALLTGAAGVTWLLSIGAGVGS